nr:FHA domain-containing protein [Armatimonadota bacterium]
TRIGGQTLAPGVSGALADGDRVQFGSIDLRLRLVRPEVSAGDMPEQREATPARAQLVTARGPSARHIPLVPGVTTIGRRAENTIVLRDDPYVSGSHAQIIAEEDTFRLTDLGSTNHTLINGEELTANEPRLLASGDEIVIGGAAYRFERITDADEAEAPPEPDAPAPDSEITDQTD